MDNSSNPDNDHENYSIHQETREEQASMDPPHIQLAFTSDGTTGFVFTDLDNSVDIESSNANPEVHCLRTWSISRERAELHGVISSARAHAREGSRGLRCVERLLTHIGQEPRLHLLSVRTQEIKKLLTRVNESLTRLGCALESAEEKAARLLSHQDSETTT